MVFWSLLIVWENNFDCSCLHLESVARGWCCNGDNAFPYDHYQRSSSESWSHGMSCHLSLFPSLESVHTEVVAVVATSIPVSWLTCFHINCHETQVVIVTVPTAPFMPGVAPAWMRWNDTALFSVQQQEHQDPWVFSVQHSAFEVIFITFPTMSISFTTPKAKMPGSVL